MQSMEDFLRILKETDKSRLLNRAEEEAEL